MRHSLWLVAVATAAVLYGALPVNAAGPPHTLSHDLTAQGEVIWNLDALVKDTFGDQTVCWDGLHLNVFAVRGNGGCPAPAARYAPYQFVFRDAHGSSFRLVSRSSSPLVGATASAIRVDGRYVSCPTPTHPTSGRSSANWVVYGGEELADSLVWCA